MVVGAGLVAVYTKYAPAAGVLTRTAEEGMPTRHRVKWNKLLQLTDTAPEDKMEERVYYGPPKRGVPLYTKRKVVAQGEEVEVLMSVDTDTFRCGDGRT